MDRDRIFTQAAVEGLIAEGATIIIYQDCVLRLDNWLAKHPGGRLAILHMVGKDATDEVTAFHRPNTLNTMKCFQIGRVTSGTWINKKPPIRGGVFQKLEPLEKPESTCTASEPQPLPITEPSTPATSRGSSPSSPLLASADCSRQRKNSPEAKSLQLIDQSRDKATPFKPAEYADWAVQEGVDLDLRDYPSLDEDVQKAIVAEYRVLQQKVVDQGLYECCYTEYFKELSRYLTLFAAFVVTLRYEWYTTSAMFLGFFWHQIMFTAHDAGHRAITQNFTIDTLIGIFIADFCCGLSIGWWKSSHNVHHLVTNLPEHDPDIQNVPLFATCPAFFKSIRSTYYDGFPFIWDSVANFMVRYQKYTYYPIMGIARFNLYLLSWLFLLSGKSSSLGSTKAWWIRPTEILSMTCYWFLYGYCLLWCTLPTWKLRVWFVLVSHILTMPLHVQITLSHWGMSTSDLGEAESFPQRQLRTTMDVECPAWLDFIHGGLQFQAIHHLFPRVPRHNLRKVQTLVKEFCSITNIQYSKLGFTDGNKRVLSRLEEVSDQLAMMVKCQDYMAQTGESGLH